MEKQTLTLKHPVPLSPEKEGDAAGEISSITFRRPKAKDLAAIEKAAKTGELSTIQIAIVAAIGDVPIEVAENLDLEDYEAATEITARFFPQEK